MPCCNISFLYNLDMPGSIYIRLLKLTILPMIASNIINGEQYYFKSLNPSEKRSLRLDTKGILFSILLSNCAVKPCLHVAIFNSRSWSRFAHLKWYYSSRVIDMLSTEKNLSVRCIVLYIVRIVRPCSHGHSELFHFPFFSHGEPQPT